MSVCEKGKKKWKRKMQVLNVENMFTENNKAKTTKKRKRKIPLEKAGQPNSPF